MVCGSAAHHLLLSQKIQRRSRCVRKYCPTDPKALQSAFLTSLSGLPAWNFMNEQCDTILAHHLIGDLLMSMAIVVHGGAGTIAPDGAEIAQAGCKEAALI